LQYLQQRSQTFPCVLHICFVLRPAGKLEHIFVIGGCDGSEPQRKYYDKLARLMPLNTMVSVWGMGVDCFLRVQV
jgi:hypothetical protein